VKIEKCQARVPGLSNPILNDRAKNLPVIFDLFIIIKQFDLIFIETAKKTVKVIKSNCHYFKS